MVVDVRSRDDYRKGHISGAINIAAADIKKAASASWKAQVAAHNCGMCHRPERRRTGSHP